MKRLIVSAGLFSLMTMLFSFSGHVTSPTAKTIQQIMARINDSLYACKYEVSNIEYRNFLADLKTKDATLAEKFKIDSTKWNRGSMEQYYHLHPAFNEFPVVNVRYEAAIAYCHWLTEKYNSDPKRKFEKVKFILPTEQEWIEAANSGIKNRMYPWGSYYMRNKNGEFLCNFKHVSDAFIVSDESGKPLINEVGIEKMTSDRNNNAFYTTNVKTFWPNKFGLYNMSGNVAEMTIEQGLTKGGSWNSYGGEVTIQTKKIFREASPEVGFRVFMKIIGNR